MAFTQVALVRPLLGGSQPSSLDYFHHDFRKKSIHYPSAGFEGNMIDLEQSQHTCSLPGTCRYKHYTAWLPRFLLHPLQVALPNKLP